MSTYIRPRTYTREQSAQLPAGSILYDVEWGIFYVKKPNGKWTTFYGHHTSDENPECGTFVTLMPQEIVEEE
ncbi:MAG TPA: hypothetical protein VHK27_03180 [Gammaproteobacteria bacterium]|nr:hypothetical protein [Gammaproteobacteria bacterium]